MECVFSEPVHKVKRAGLEQGFLSLKNRVDEKWIICVHIDGTGSAQYQTALHF